MPILEIRSTDADQSLSYLVMGTGDPSKYNAPNDSTLRADSNDNIHTFSDGTYIIIGHTNNQYGDAYDVDQQPDAFRKYDGSSGYSVAYNGTDITTSLDTISSNVFVPDFIDIVELRRWFLTRYPEVAEGSVFPDPGSTEDGGGPGGGDDGPITDPDPEGMELDGTLTISSTSRTPRMEYIIEVVGEVQGGSSLEESDTITPGNPTVITGNVGPSGDDTYNISGYVTSWSMINADNNSQVDQSRYIIEYNGEEIGLWELLGNEKPQYLDSSAAALGGGQYYSQKITEEDADYVVENITEARDVLDNRASSGDIVFVPGDVEIYSPGKSERFHVPSGATFASDRGVEGSDGALIHTDARYSYGADGLITADENARVTGFRVRGPHPDVRWHQHTYQYEMSGIRANGPNVEIDNNEPYGWAVCIRANTDSGIHHNYIHHANMDGLGYAVSTGESEGAIIEYNQIEHYRHAVAASGEGGYEARHNILNGPQLAHAFDQHVPGGTYTDIHHNTSSVMEQDRQDGQPVFAAFRGGEMHSSGNGPQNAEVYKNWVKGNTQVPNENETGWRDEFIIQAQANSWGDITYWDNHLGTSDPGDDDIGAPR